MIGMSHEFHHRAPAKPLVKKICQWVGEMALPIKVLIAKPDDLSSRLRTYMMEGEHGLLG